MPPAPPAGYQGYQAGNSMPRKNSGMAIAGFVLALVGIIPCFWFWVLQIPGYLGVILSAIGLKQTKDGKMGARGLAIAGLIIGIIVVLLALAISAYVYTSDDCVTDGLFKFTCISTN